MTYLTKGWSKIVSLLLVLALVVASGILISCKKKEKPHRVIPREDNTFVERFKEGDLVPNFSLPNINGVEVNFERYRGKFIILTFWATFSPTCLAELPGMEQVVKQFRSRSIEIVAINLDPKENRADVIDFVKNNRLSFPVLMDSGLKVKELFGVRGLPETFFVDPDGKFVTVVDPVWANDSIRLTSDFPWNSKLYSDLIDGQLKKYEERIKELAAIRKKHFASAASSSSGNQENK
ncbi:MAG: TlpA family protein disulfide reductase [Deltaproteobacteria bacterium]|nr:TlpA family protein disulfide reductase [Deltaproteobacteria bacterium]